VNPFASFLAQERAADFHRQARQDRVAASARPVRIGHVALVSRIRTAIVSTLSERTMPAGRETAACD
jgi:hypothetical protein